jgi:hypothetical protein
MKKAAVGFAVCVLGVTGIVICSVWPPKDALALANFIILALTLIVLVWYAYDTNSIARVTRDRWKREGVLSTMYSMELVGNKGQAGKTMFRIHNQSVLVVRATVACNFRVYGEPIEAGPAYDGEKAWLAFPQQMIQGWFEIESLLQKKGKSVAAMIKESTPVNRKDQFTMLLQVEFWDELGTRRKLPARSHYFDFDQWAWIPHITEGHQSL